MPRNKQIQSLLKWMSSILFFCITVGGYAQESGDLSAVSVDMNSAQSLTLFEGVETTESRGGPLNRSARESRVTTAEPEFTLVGVSRAGTKYSAILRHKDGEDFIVKAEPSATTIIPDHSAYAIVDVTSASVSVRYPSNNACIEFTERGVSCSSAANIAQLVLANGEPLVMRNPANERAEEASTVASEEIVETQATSRSNPFEALRNGRRGDTLNVGADGARSGAGRFTPRRINPEDVPEGKRVVATPFGDRLVDQ